MRAPSLGSTGRRNTVVSEATVAGWCAWSMLDLLACSSLVRILSARRLGQGSAVADRGAARSALDGAEHRQRMCTPRNGTARPCRGGAGLLVSLGRVLQQIFVESSAGVRQPNVLRGRVFNAKATAAR